MTETEKCTVYEREFVVDFIHNRFRMYREVFVPSKQMTITYSNSTKGIEFNEKDGLNNHIKLYVKRAERANTEPIAIIKTEGEENSTRYGKVEDVREEEVPNHLINRCWTVLEAGGDSLTL